MDIHRFLLLELLIPNPALNVHFFYQFFLLIINCKKYRQNLLQNVMSARAHYHELTCGTMYYWKMIG